MDTDRLTTALEALCAADPVTRPQRALAVLSLVPPLVRQDGGLEALYRLAPRFDACGGFTGTPWDRPARLRPRLWAGSFDADAPYPWTETLSTLRLLAVAVGEAAHEDVDADEARRLLERVLALNMDKLMDASSEASRMHRVQHHEAAGVLLRFVLGRLPRADFLRDVAQEVEAIMAQRPVWTHHVRATLRLVSEAPGADDTALPSLRRHVEAVLGPTPPSMRFRDAALYREALEAGDVEVDAEVDAMAASLRATGLACKQHAVLLRHVADDPGRLARALGLHPRGEAVMQEHAEAVRDLVLDIIRPGTAQTAYGLARFLERGLLERPEVAAGMQRLASLELDPEMERVLQTSADADPDLTGVQVLLGGAVRVLGQPLGIGQGNNPTCQSARAISLWSQYRPGYLLETLAAAAEGGDVAMMFEGFVLHSSQLGGGLAPHLDPDLDPVSLVLVPHLDRLYDEMMKRVAGRGEDGHKWVNPGLYGRIVAPGFASCFDPITWQVRGHADFVRRFYACFHPTHSDGHTSVYAVPVGITVTDNRGRLLGLHAVTLQRVDTDSQGNLRAYFYNPNNEGRQDWGEGVKPSVRRHGEEEGESSLPFAAFASRVYAFHHPIRLPGDPEAVPEAEVEKVTRMARTSWGRSYAWAP